MKELHAKVKGALGEAKVTAKLIEMGYPVFKEFGDNSKVDLIILVDRQPIKLQVKAYSAINGSISLRWDKSGPNYRFIYHPDDFDILALYSITNDQVYFISSKRLFKTGYLSLRIFPTKNNQIKKCNMAEEFLNIKDVLRDYTPDILTNNVEDNDIVQTATL